MTTSGSYEELFKRELAKFDPVCLEVAKNVDLQQRLLHQLKVRLTPCDDFVACGNRRDPAFRNDQYCCMTSMILSDFYLPHFLEVNQSEMPFSDAERRPPLNVLLECGERLDLCFRFAHLVLH